MKHFVFKFDNVEDLHSQLERIDYKFENASAVLAQFYTSYVDDEFMLEVSSCLRKVIPVIDVIGCTTIGEIINGDKLDSGSIISITVFNEAKVFSFHLECAPHKEVLSGKLLGRNVKRKCGKEVKATILLGTTHSLVSEDFLSGFASEVDDVPIVGGGAGDHLKLVKTLVLHNDFVSSSAFLAVAICGEGVSLKVENILGWQPFGKEMVVTKTDRNSILEIDNQNAADLYQHYIGRIENGCVDELVGFPLIIKQEQNFLAKVPIAFGDDGAIKFTSNVAEGAKVRFGYGDLNSILNAVNVAIERLGSFHPEAIYLFSCGCRRLFLQKEVKQELSPFQDLAPTAGFFTLGEFSNAVSKTNVLNAELVALAIREGNVLQQNNNTNHIENRKLQESTRVLKRLMHFISTVTKELEQANHELHKQANTDGLTGIMNRRCFDERLASEMSRCIRYERKAALILMDIDHFKSVNDNYGHQVGDKVLQFIASLLKSLIRETDVCARFGGEEFAILLTDTILADAINLAERIRNSIEVESRDSGLEFLPAVTSSFGISELSEGITIETVVKLADEALYKAKSDGRNCVRQAFHS
ncbi:MULTISPECIES: sensor domain-containing diguanylate cyclase [unclassified Pseudoalteromonas]|uniref:sensor domain-containing diguanylate cyclase n=1 Tax=unclassified Pseudoalteromonas TaxID=194690 RepID=UPI003014DF0D